MGLAANDYDNMLSCLIHRIDSHLLILARRKAACYIGQRRNPITWIKPTLENGSIVHHRSMNFRWYYLCLDFSIQHWNYNKYYSRLDRDSTSLGGLAGSTRTFINPVVSNFGISCAAQREIDSNKLEFYFMRIDAGELLKIYRFYLGYCYRCS